ncbi:MAG: flagellar protein FlgN [Bacillota bacterium]
MTSHPYRDGADAEMATLAGEVARLLSDHCRAYEDLKVLLKAQTEALRDDDLKRLQKILRGQDEILAGVVAREGTRCAVEARIEERTGSPGIDWEYLGREFAIPRETIEQAVRAEGRLKDLTGEISSINAANGELVEGALRFIRYSMEAIRVMALETNTYHDGEDPPEPPSVLLDHRY